MPFSARRQWMVSSPPDEILRKMNDLLVEKNAKTIEVNSKTLQALIGSKLKLRLFGAFLVSPETLPVKIVLSMDEKEG